MGNGTGKFGDLENARAPQNEDEGHSNENYFDKFVGEGKKYKDTEALAKAVYDKDEFINRLLEEKRGIEEDLSKRLTLEEVLDKLNSRGKSEHEEHQPDTPSRKDDDNRELDIDKLVEQKLSDYTRKQSRDSNIDSAISKLEETWGDSWRYELSKRTKELGVSADFLEDVAGRSPAAFLNLVGANVPTKERNFTEVPPKQQKNPGAFSGSNSNYKEWDDLNSLRKSDPRKYWTAEVQNRLMKLAKEGKARV